LFFTGRRIPRASFTKETRLKHLIPTIIDLEMWECTEKKRSAAAILKLNKRTFTAEDAKPIQPVELDFTNEEGP